MQNKPAQTVSPIEEAIAHFREHEVARRKESTRIDAQILENWGSGAHSGETIDLDHLQATMLDCLKKIISTPCRTPAEIKQKLDLWLQLTGSEECDAHLTPVERLILSSINNWNDVF